MHLPPCRAGVPGKVYGILPAVFSPPLGRTSVYPDNKVKDFVTTEVFLFSRTSHPMDIKILCSCAGLSMSRYGCGERGDLGIAGESLHAHPSDLPILCFRFQHKIAFWDLVSISSLTRIFSFAIIREKYRTPLSSMQKRGENLADCIMR